MAKRQRVWNQAIFKRYIKEGRGQGEGANYLPWLRVQSFASRGSVSRVNGHKTGRVHHLMSKNELAYFYVLDWSEDIADIREQYPLLNLKQAMRCASEANIKYPKDNLSGFPYVLTCDFLIIMKDGSLKARTVKMKKELENRRVIEKLEIERRYWQYEGVDWKIATEDSISFTKAKNIEWLYSAINAKLPLTIDEFESAKRFLLKLANTNGFSVYESLALVEGEFLLSKWQGLILFKQMILNKEIYIDLSLPINLSKKGGVLV